MSPEEIANIISVLYAAENAFQTVSNDKDDILSWNEGGEVYEAIHRVRELRKSLERI